MKKEKRKVLRVAVAFVAVIALTLLAAEPLLAKPPEPEVSRLSSAVSHSASTTHEFEVGQDGGPDRWSKFQSSDGQDHLYGGNSTYIAVQFGGSGGTIDDGGDGDFTNIIPVSLTDPSGTGYLEHTYCMYYGRGYRITQYTYSNDTADGDDWCIIELTIRNTGGSPLTSVYVMLHLDWDISTDNEYGDRSGWDSGRQIIYQYDGDGIDYYACGASLLNQTLHGYGTGPYAEDDDGNEGDTWRDGEFTTPSDNVNTTPGDYVTWIMAELPTIGPGSTEAVCFAMSTGYSTTSDAEALSNLQSDMDDAIDTCPPGCCDPSPVPTVSQWGIIGMAVLFAGGLVWAVRRRQTSVAR